MMFEREHNPPPASYRGVMVSGTFRDLEAHRAALQEALLKEELHPIGMETHVVGPDEDILSSSLEMVRNGSAYIGLISHRCGQVPACAARNPEEYSLSRLEFEEAQRLGRPTLVFIMGAEHPVKAGDVEADPEKRGKLEEYRGRVKQNNRLYVEFQSLADFKEQAIHAVAGLRRHLEEHPSAGPGGMAAAGLAPGPGSRARHPIPAPPAFCCLPPYIGSHQFIGRASQLEILDDWAGPANPHSLLLFEAIGGTGKSILTWEWATRRAPGIRGDWAGRFWYSFYERGAVLADFCVYALAYITGRPAEEFRRKKTPELGELLLARLTSDPWLLILDGLERLLVAYHRIDAAQLADEEAGKTDVIAHRDPCAAIRPEDDELLRRLAAAAPSKILLTTRLIPRVLLNQAGQPIPGVRQERLPGLRPRDAEALFRACGVTGDSRRIREYLQRHCDCHPLVTGVLAGLVTDYLPDRGNFDAWEADPRGGGRLNLAALDLKQKRNHILKAALAALDEKDRRLLSTLSLLSCAVDYQTLAAINPHLPPEPAKVDKPEPPGWKSILDGLMERAREEYPLALKRWEESQQARAVWRESPEYHAAPEKLNQTVINLERRRLLQYDGQSKRYDLHPVVRGVAAGMLRAEEKQAYGRRVIDHFSEKSHSPYAEAETLEDVSDGITLVRLLLQVGNYRQAYEALFGDLNNALHVNLDAQVEMLSLLRPFFPDGWAASPVGREDRQRAYLVNSAAVALSETGESALALKLYGAALLLDLQSEDRSGAIIVLRNIAITLEGQKRFARAEQCSLLALRLAGLTGKEQDLFSARLARFLQLAKLGRWEEAEAMWRLLEPVECDFSRNSFFFGLAERSYAWFCFYRGRLTEEQLAGAERLIRQGKTRRHLVDTLALRGRWELQQGRFARAAESLHEVVNKFHEVGMKAATDETRLAIAQFHRGRLPSARQEAERLSRQHPADLELAELWRLAGEHEQAKKHALAAYQSAWGDGEPYVHRYDLNQAAALLEKLGLEVPRLPPYDPAKAEQLPWEAEVRAAIDKWEAEKEAERAAGEGDPTEEDCAD